jgi:hypothetical protein
MASHQDVGRCEGPPREAVKGGIEGIEIPSEFEVIGDGNEPG